MPSQILRECGTAIARHGLTIATVESATAGRLAYEISLLPESGKILKGGIVSYDAVVKETILKVPGDIIKKFTPESPEVTQEMSSRLGALIDADIHVAITGLTTSGGSESPDKPVGTMFVCAMIKGKCVPAKEVFSGTPEHMILQTIDLVATLILSELN